jgi:hypothetical protein
MVRADVRRPKDRFRVKLGSFYLQGEFGGWGQLAYAMSFTREDADKKIATLKTRGTEAKRVEV